MGSSTKTVTDHFIENFFAVPGNADKTAKKMSAYMTDFEREQANLLYWRHKQQYRKIFSTKWLKKFDLFPDTTAKDSTGKDIEFCPLVSLKEKGKRTLPDRDTNRLLGRMNVDYNDFDEILDNKDINSAYILCGLPLDVDQKDVNKALYDTFNLIDVSPPGKLSIDTHVDTGSSLFSISFSKAQLKYTGSIRKTIVNGKANNDGYAFDFSWKESLIDTDGDTGNDPENVIVSRTSTVSGNISDRKKEYNRILNIVNTNTNVNAVTNITVSTVITGQKESKINRVYRRDNKKKNSNFIVTYSKQISATQYQEIEVKGLKMTYSIGGHTSTGYASDGGDKFRMILPVKVLEDLKYREYVEVFDRALAFMGYAEKTIKLKWYQTIIFRLVVTLIIIIVSIYFPVINVAGFSIELSTTAIISSFVISEIANHLDLGLIGDILVVAAGILLANGGNISSLIDIAAVDFTNFGQLMKSLDVAVKLAGAYNQHELEDYRKESIERIQKQEESIRIMKISSAELDPITISGANSFQHQEVADEMLANRNKEYDDLRKKDEDWEDSMYDDSILTHIYKTNRWRHPKTIHDEYERASFQL